MASNLLQTGAGRYALRRAVCWLTHRRMAKWFKRNFYKEFFRWWKGTPVDKSWNWSTVLGDLNVQHDVEINDMNTLLGQLMCLPESIAPQNIYVDPANGSDEYGDGSQSKPWASLWFLDGLPKRINHAYRILILNDLITDDICLNLDFGPYGSLAILGVGAPTITGGPFNMTLAQDEDGVSSPTLEVQLAAAGWAVDQWVGNWIQYIDGPGPLANSAQPVHKSFNDRVVSLKPWFGAPPAPNDEFQFIRPSVKIECNSFQINARGPINDAPNMNGGANIGSSRVVVGNLDIDVSNSTTARAHYLSFTGACNFMLPFLRVSWPVAETTTPLMLLQTKTTNYYQAYDTQIETYAQTGIANFSRNLEGNWGGTPMCSTLLWMNEPPQVDDRYTLQTLENAIVAWMDLRGVHYNYGNMYGHFMYASAIYNYGMYNANNIAMDGLNTEWCFIQRMGQARISNSHFSCIIKAGAPAACLKLEMGGFKMISLTCPAASPFTNVGIDFDGMGWVHTETNPAAITGTNGDIDFAIAGILNHPAMNLTTVNDGNGNYVGWLLIP